MEQMTIAGIKEFLDKKELSAVEVVERCLKNIEERDGEVHAFLEIFDDVVEQARAADAARANGNSGALLGIPIALKDNILIKGRHASAASKMLENYRATYDATVTKKLKEVGAVFIGRTNCDEFAMGSSTESSVFGATKNPHDISRVPGGSSGGSAAVVSAGFVPASLGSDTGGSIRQPASFCGVVGMKPTYGSVSRNGLIALGSSLDIIGPLANTVTDAELLFNIIRGQDALDSTTLPDHRKDKNGINMEMNKGTKNEPKVIGVPYHFFENGLSKDAREVFENALKKLSSLGFTVKEIELPHVKYALAAYYVIMPAEASTNLARYDGVKYGLHAGGGTLSEDYIKTRRNGFGEEVRRRILLGTFVLSAGYYDAYYGKALSVRQLISEDFRNAFSSQGGGVDIIATPTTPGPAFPLGTRQDPLSMYLEDIFTVPANISGVPAISIPSGMVSEGEKELPLGLQFIGPMYGENRLFTVGKRFLGETV
jgi:aspartyl-tRNA(Asn)/glutamyl-tRNA(Gln) amidotransferase subunit A